MSEVRRDVLSRRRRRVLAMREDLLRGWKRRPASAGALDLTADGYFCPTLRAARIAQW